jgi:hypothetical protein
MNMMKNEKPYSDLNPFTIWVLAPHIETNDPNLSYYYDFSQSIKEYTEVFKQLGKMEMATGNHS